MCTLETKTFSDFLGYVVKDAFLKNLIKGSFMWCIFNDFRRTIVLTGSINCIFFKLLNIFLYVNVLNNCCSSVAWSCLTLCNLVDCIAHQASFLMGFSRQRNWSGLPFSSPGNLPDPGIEPWSFVLAGSFFTTEPPLWIICTLFHAGFVSSFLASILFECCYLLFYRKWAETSKETLLCTAFFIFMEMKPNEIDYKGELGYLKEESLWPL